MGLLAAYLDTMCKHLHVIFFSLILLIEDNLHLLAAISHFMKGFELSVLFSVILFYIILC